MAMSVPPATRWRLAVVMSHPVQYHSPWFRALGELVDLCVLYAHRTDPSEHARTGFGVAFDWDVPVLEGYRFEWLPNVARRPRVDRFFGCSTPSLRGVLTPARFDAVLVSGWQLLSYWQAIRAARRARLPVLIRGDSQLRTRRGPFTRVVKRLVYPHLLGVFDTCLAVGRRNEEYYRHYHVSPSRICSSPHSVDNEFFSRGAAAAVAAPGGARAALALPPSVATFAFVGKLIPEKRPLDFLIALDRLKADGRAAHGLIVGDGPLRSQLEAHIHRHDTPVTWTGFVNQSRMPAIYAAVDAVVLPSASETWGLVVNEAMACGVPSIVSDAVGCAPDLVLDATTGFVYPCGDTTSLADRMRRFAQDPGLSGALAGTCRAHIRRFSPAVTAAGVVTALEALRSASAPVARLEALP